MALKKVLFLLVLTLVGLDGFCQQLISGNLMHGGIVREYAVFLPSSYQPGQQLPAVINLHGFNLDGGQQTFYSGLNDIAEREDFIVIIPEGVVGTTFFQVTGTHWNSYWGTGIDDMGFLNLLIDRIFTDYSIDLARVYATGFSNGGYMTHRLACEMSGRIAAIGCVAGSVVNQQLGNCSPPRAVPILQIHGTNDGTVPFNGSPGFAPSIPDLVDLWVRHNHCDSIANLVLLPDTDTADGSTVMRLEYNNGDDNSRVWFYQIDNGEHTWPKAPYDLDGAGTNQDFDASQHIWDFFKDVVHPNPDQGTLLSTEAALPVTSLDMVQSQGWLTVSSTQPELKGIQIIEMTGKVLTQTTHAGWKGSVQVDLSGISDGIYVAVLETRRGIVTRKFAHVL